MKEIFCHAELYDVGNPGHKRIIQMSGAGEKNDDEAVAAIIRRIAVFAIKNRPIVVCLCGSTRFWREFQRTSLRETLAGKIVLSIGAASGTDDEHFGNMSAGDYARVKSSLDNLHKRKIDLADEVLILNVGGYIGESTRSELEYAVQHRKVIRFLEPAKPEDRA